MWNKIKHWWFTLIKEEYELTIYFPDTVVELPDGSKKAGFTPKTYKIGVLKKVSPTQFIFIDLEGHKHEISVVNPVGYDLKKIY